MNNDNNGWETSAQAWMEFVERDPNRLHLLDPVMLRLCGDVAGRKVLDAGCGEGRFCRMLTEAGALTTGIDPTGDFIGAARRRHHGGSYHICGAEYLPFDDGEFDMTVSYVTLLDIDDYRGAIAEMARVTKPGGRLVVANLSSFATASPHLWWRDEQGKKLFWTLDDYAVPRKESVEWAGIRVHNWHRPLSAYMQEFLSHGLVLEHFDEPLFEGEGETPRGLEDQTRLPHFVVMRWRKP